MGPAEKHVADEPRLCEVSEGEIPLDLCRQLLADEAEGLSDEEVQLIRRHAAALAHVLCEIADGQMRA